MCIYCHLKHLNNFILVVFLFIITQIIKKKKHITPFLLYFIYSSWRLKKHYFFLGFSWNLFINHQLIKKLNIFHSMMSLICFRKIFEYNPNTWNNANDQSRNLHSQLQDYTKNHSMNGCKKLIILQLH